MSDEAEAEGAPTRAERVRVAAMVAAPEERGEGRAGVEEEEQQREEEEQQREEEEQHEEDEE